MLHFTLLYGFTVISKRCLNLFFPGEVTEDGLRSGEDIQKGNQILDDRE